MAAAQQKARSASSRRKVSRTPEMPPGLHGGSCWGESSFSPMAIMATNMARGSRWGSRGKMASGPP